ncbi:hypothetical protein AX17_007547 [Amanita inopinata Kibby_2008]|nr:hypothetical protein AX17_007547 [Amanita inopinata Kibby_2008]
MLPRLTNPSSTWILTGTNGAFESEDRACFYPEGGVGAVLGPDTSLPTTRSKTTCRYVNPTNLTSNMNTRSSLPYAKRTARRRNTNKFVLPPFSELCRIAGKGIEVDSSHNSSHPSRASHADQKAESCTHLPFSASTSSYGKSGYTPTTTGFTRTIPNPAVHMPSHSTNTGFSLRPQSHSQSPMISSTPSFLEQTTQTRTPLKNGPSCKLFPAWQWHETAPPSEPWVDVSTGTCTDTESADDDNVSTDEVAVMHPSRVVGPLRRMRTRPGTHTWERRLTNSSGRLGAVPTEKLMSGYTDLFTYDPTEGSNWELWTKPVINEMGQKQLLCTWPVADGQEEEGEAENRKEGVCGYRAKGQLVKRHLESTHLNIRRFMCTWPGCGQKFAQKGGLEIHHRSHTGEKPHECEYKCGMWFNDPSGKHRHAVQEHGYKPKPRKSNYPNGRPDRPCLNRKASSNQD